MQVSIVGSGNMAHGIGRRIVAGKHDLTIYDRNAKKATELATKLGAEVKGGALEDAILGDVVIFTLPYQAIPEVIEKYRESLEGNLGFS